MPKDLEGELRIASSVTSGINNMNIGGFVSIKCEKPIVGDKIVLSRSYKVFTYQNEKIKNKITVCNLKVNSDG